MSAPMPPHYGEELQDLLDGRVSAPRRSEIEAHVRTCARCRRELDALRWVKEEAARSAGSVALPEGLEARVRTALDVGPTSHTTRRRQLARRKWIAGALAAAALLFFFRRGHKSGVTPEIVAQDFLAYERGTLQLEFESSDPQAIEAYFARRGIEFPTRVLDLAMMQYTLGGARVTQLENTPSAVFAYRGADDSSLLCQMYEGRVTDLPPADDVRENNGVRFHVYQSDGVTLVFWQEGDVVCVLASDLPRESVVQLAFAKAARVEA